MEKATCFRCQEVFELTKENEKDFINSGLCPACFGQSLAEMYQEVGNATVNQHFSKMINGIDNILEDIKGINECLRAILKEYKK